MLRFTFSTKADLKVAVWFSYSPCKRLAMWLTNSWLFSLLVALQFTYKQINLLNLLHLIHLILRCWSFVLFFIYFTLAFDLCWQCWFTIFAVKSLEKLYYLIYFSENWDMKPSYFKRNRKQFSFDILKRKSCLILLI